MKKNKHCQSLQSIRLGFLFLSYRRRTGASRPDSQGSTTCSSPASAHQPALLRRRCLRFQSLRFDIHAVLPVDQVPALINLHLFECDAGKKKAAKRGRGEKGPSHQIKFCRLENEKKGLLSPGVYWEDLYSDSCQNCLSQ